MNYEELESYLLTKPGVEKDFKVEWEWDRFLINGKMFATICNDKTEREIITLKCEPAFGDELRNQYEDIVPGYYMNKVHWNSVYLEGKVPEKVVMEMIDQSYELIFSKLSKKMQRKIMDEKE